MLLRLLTLVTASAVALLTLAAEPASAQQRGRGWNGQRINNALQGNFGINPGQWTYGAYPGWNNYGYTSNRGYYAPNYSTWSYRPFDYGVRTYTPAQYGVIAPNVMLPSGYAAPVVREVIVPAPATTVVSSPALNSQSALITVHVPAQAEVWIDDRLMTETGNVRQFVTPALPPDQTVSYAVRARWQDREQQFDQTRKADVRGGDRVTIDFLTTSATSLDKPLSGSGQDTSLAAPPAR